MRKITILPGACFCNVIRSGIVKSESMVGNKAVNAAKGAAAKAVGKSVERLQSSCATSHSRMLNVRNSIKP